MKRLLFACLILLFAGSASASTYAVHKGFGKQWDTLIMKVKYGTVQTRDSVIYTSKALVDTNVLFGDDTIFTLLFMYKNNGGYWQSYTEQWLRTSHAGPYQWNTISYLAMAATDSLVSHYYKNGLSTYDNNEGAVTSFGSIANEVYRDTVYRIDLDWWVSGRSYPITQTFTITWDSLSGGLPTSGSGHVCAVSVDVLNSDRSPAVGVWVTAYLTASSVRDSSGTGYTNSPIYKQTNSQGRATFNCVWSNYLIPATAWRFTAHTSAIGGMRKTVMVPSTASYLLNMNQ